MPVSFLSLDMFMDVDMIALLVFVAVILVFVWRDRENIERHSVLIYRRTDHGIEWLDRIAEWQPSLWKVWSTLGVAAGFLTMFGIFFYLFRHAMRALMDAGAVPAVGLLLPTTADSASMTSGAFFIPIWYWILGIATVMVFHEMMHGVIARNEGFPVKSVGWFVLGILPGAFVEPEGEEMLPDPDAADEEEEEDAEDEEDEDESSGPWGDGPWFGKLRVLAAGSGANLTIALVLMGIMYVSTVPAGVQVLGVMNNSAAQQADMQDGMVIERMDGEKITDKGDLIRVTDDFEIGERISVAGRYNGSRFNLTAELGERPERNFTYQPAPVDPVLVRMEQVLPGTIDMYEALNDPFVTYGKRTELERWRWVREKYDGLDQRAEQKIAAMEAQLDDGPEPWLGIRFGDEQEYRSFLLPYAGFLDALFKMFLFIVIIHAGIGSANLMPLKPLDGGWMLSVVTERYRPDWEPGLSKYVSVLTLGLLLINLVVPFLFGFLM